jgi:hypothetical protein
LKAYFCNGSTCTTSTQAVGCKKHWETLGITEASRATKPIDCYTWTDGSGATFGLSIATYHVDKKLRTGADCNCSAHPNVEVLFDGTNITGLKFNEAIYPNEHGYSTCRERVYNIYKGSSYDNT